MFFQLRNEKNNDSQSESTRHFKERENLKWQTTKLEMLLYIDVDVIVFFRSSAGKTSLWMWYLVIYDNIVINIVKFGGSYDRIACKCSILISEHIAKLLSHNSCISKMWKPNAWLTLYLPNNQSSSIPSLNYSHACIFVLN